MNNSYNRDVPPGVNSESHLRPLCQVQLAHDVLVGIILEPDLCPPPASSERKALICAADVLCWVLQHDHNVTFAKNLKAYLAYAEEKGFSFNKKEHPCKPTN